MSTISLRIDENLKKEIQSIAKELDISLNQLINLKLRELKEKRSINISFNNDYELIELEKNELNNELIEMRNETLKKDKSLFTNI